MQRRSETASDMYVQGRMIFVIVPDFHDVPIRLLLVTSHIYVCFDWTALAYVITSIRISRVGS